VSGERCQVSGVRKRKAAGTKKAKHALSDNSFFVILVLIVIVIHAFVWWKLVY